MLTGIRIALVALLLLPALARADEDISLAKAQLALAQAQAEANRARRRASEKTPDSLPAIDFDLRALNAAPAVAAPAAFQRGSFYTGHDCPECGRIVLAKSGSAGRGQHWHVCPADGCYWRHDDK